MPTTDDQQLLHDIAGLAGDELLALHTLARGGEESELLSRLTAIGVKKLGQRLRFKEALAVASLDDISAAQIAVPSDATAEELEAEFPQGCVVTITGLAKKPELNGQGAEVLGRPEEGRFPVRVAHTKGASIKVKPDNLLRGSPLDAPDDAGGSANPHHYTAVLAAVRDPELGLEAKRASLRTFEGLFQSVVVEHHDRLAQAELPQALLAQIDRPCAVFGSGPMGKMVIDDEAGALRLSALACLHAFCRRANNEPQR